MKCEECRELLFDYYDNEVDVGIKIKIREHFEICPACRSEFEELSSRLNFFKVNMPDVQLEANFTQKVMQNINAAQTTAFFNKIMLRLGIAVAIFTLAVTISIAPIMFSLLTLFGSILIGIISTVSAIGEVFPLVQLSGSIILIIMLLGVTASIRRIVLRDSFK